MTDETNSRGWPRVRFSHRSGQSECGTELFLQLGRPITETDKRIIDEAMSAADLFANENVTKDDRMIHAWSYEKATEYLIKISDSKETR